MNIAADQFYGPANIQAGEAAAQRLAQSTDGAEALQQFRVASKPNTSRAATVRQNKCSVCAEKGHNSEQTHLSKHLSTTGSSLI